MKAITKANDLTLNTALTLARALWAEGGFYGPTGTKPQALEIIRWRKTRATKEENALLMDYHRAHCEAA